MTEKMNEDIETQKSYTTIIPMNGHVSARVASFATVFQTDLFLCCTVWTARRWVIRATADIILCQKLKIESVLC
jgi:hypothetical protein